MSARTSLRSRLLVAATALAATWIVLEAGAWCWLHFLAGETSFRRYATIEAVRARAARDGRPPARYEAHRYIGYIGARNFRDGDDRHDALGFRGDGFPERKPDGEYRIFCMGGSTTYTTFVKDPELAYPAQLQRALRARGFTGVRVINAGVAGYTTYETLVSFLLRVRDLDPDMILVYHGINDAVARVVWPPSAYRGDNSGYAGAGGNWQRRTPLLHRSTLSRFLLLRLGRIESADDLLGHVAPPTPSRLFWEFVDQVANGTYPDGVFVRAPVEEMLRRNPPIYFRRNLEHLLAAAKGWGVQPVLATFFANREKRDPFFTEPFAAAIDEQNAILRALGAETDTPVFDYAAVAPSEPRLYWDATHVEAEGARLKAERFADYLAGSGLLPAAP